MARPAVFLAGANGPYFAAGVTVKSAIHTVPVRSPTRNLITFQAARSLPGTRIGEPVGPRFTARSR